ncbi:hypothetical protein DLAC_10016 [Tieghemostelium lacteum]|uniref:Uncharacterized protein n=1 Tax=Tieghemostelium lacteum TaxID=361077 RepID=A0A151Z5W6_TIELA|nr:hypothetical protein DLAC_10016 [Tieghemostelium lacteum]|eukprot:KYQ89353.1 hypothetical protein DLAC_10016 [Tieghemostelium lacteum]
MFGPPRPPKPTDSNKNDNDDDIKKVHGPILPNKEDKPLVEQKKKVYGPSFGRDSVDDSIQPTKEEHKEPNTKKRVLGPSFEKDDEEDEETKPSPIKKPMIGPSLNNTKTVVDSDEEDENEYQQNLGEWEKIKKSRDNELSLNKDSDGKLKREEWMTALPTDRKIGSTLTNRTFSKNSNVNVNKVDGSWIDKQDKLLTPTTATTPSIIQRDNNKLEKTVMGDTKKPKSLLEIHQDNLKKSNNILSEKKNSSKSPNVVGQPYEFDREKAMEIQKVDREYLSKIVNTSNELNDRFSKGRNN